MKLTSLATQGLCVGYRGGSYIKRVIPDCSAASWELSHTASGNPPFVSLGQGEWLSIAQLSPSGWNCPSKRRPSHFRVQMTSAAFQFKAKRSTESWRNLCIHLLPPPFSFLFTFSKYELIHSFRGRTRPDAGAGLWSSRQISQALLALIFMVVVEEGSKGIWPQCILDKICLSYWTGQEAWERVPEKPQILLWGYEKAVNIPNLRARDSPGAGRFWKQRKDFPICLFLIYLLLTLYYWAGASIYPLSTKIGVCFL